VQDIPANQQPALKGQLLHGRDVYHTIFKLMGLNMKIEYAGQVVEDKREAYKLVFRDTKDDGEGNRAVLETHVFIDAKTNLDFNIQSRRATSNKNVRLSQAQKRPESRFPDGSICVRKRKQKPACRKFKLFYMNINEDVDDKIFPRPQGSTATTDSSQANRFSCRGKWRRAKGVCGRAAADDSVPSAFCILACWPLCNEMVTTFQLANT
jgi:hypothetical protein